MPIPQLDSPEYRLWKFMLSYQRDNHGIPPTMEEMVEACELNFRSSAKYQLESLVAMRVVEAIFPEGQARRYLALEEPKSVELWKESPFDGMAMTVPSVSKAP
jgi:hypothetical protein